MKNKQINKKKKVKNLSKQQIIPFMQKNLDKYKIYLKYKNNKDPKQHKLQLKE